MFGEEGGQAGWDKIPSFTWICFECSPYYCYKFAPFLHVRLHQNKPLSAKKRFSQTGGRREEFFPDGVIQYQVEDNYEDNSFADHNDTEAKSSRWQNA